MKIVTTVGSRRRGSGLVLVTLAASALAACAQYTAYDLGPGQAWGINNAGVVVGTTAFGRAYSYSRGVMSDLGPGAAWDINDAGTIVGQNGAAHAFTYSNGRMTDLGTLSGGMSWATRINSAGTIVGLSTTGGYITSRGFNYSSGYMRDIGTLGGASCDAEGLSDSGVIVGASRTSSGWNRAFSYKDGQMTMLGTLGGEQSWAYGINNSGTIVGQSTKAGEQNAWPFATFNGEVRELLWPGSIAGNASDINDAGAVVGWCYFSDGLTHPFVSKNGSVTDLTPYLERLGLTGGGEALRINDLGDIVGYGLTGSGAYHAVLLAVPEPSSLLIVLLGLSAVGLRRRVGGRP